MNAQSHEVKWHKNTIKKKATCSLYTKINECTAMLNVEIDFIQRIHRNVQSLT